MKKILSKILNWVLRNNFRAITTEDIFVEDKKNGIIRYKGKPLDIEYKIKLGQDAERLRNSIVWKMLQNEGEYQAYQAGIKSSGKDTELLFAKAMIHTLKVLDARLEQMSKF